MSDFRNAYHFVPRNPPQDLKPLPKKQADYGLGPDRISEGHAAYAPGTHSGRLTCTVTLMSDTVIGATRYQVKNSYSEVAPFLFGGKPAIPASSLKGVLSSVAESISRAPYRVLSDEKLTVAYQDNGNWRRHSPDRQSNPLTYVQDHVPENSRPLAIHSDADAPRRKTRSAVSPVELMFGYIIEAAQRGPDHTRFKGKVAKGTPVSAAGKLRISHALLTPQHRNSKIADLFSQGTLDPKVLKTGGLKLVPLKEQSQPMKEPKQNGKDVAGYKGLRSATPNFYFVNKDRKDTFISKKDFAARHDDYETQGTKFYLHHPDTDQQPWLSANTSKSHQDLERRAAVLPFRKDLTFEFHIDFDNLSPHEFNILCYALQPSEQFCHKIGLGKALGLGSIRIKPTRLVLIDRKRRYQPEKVFAADERTNAAEEEGLQHFQAAVLAHSSWLDAQDPAAKTALLAIGETHRFGPGDPPADSNIPVLWVPLTKQKFDARKEPIAEKDSFAWFAENDRRWKQKLKPIGADGNVPLLSTNSPTPTTKLKPVKRGLVAKVAVATGQAEGEQRGKFLYYNQKKDPPEGLIAPQNGGKERVVTKEQCIACGLHKAQRGRPVLFVPEADDGQGVVSIRLA